MTGSRDPIRDYLREERRIEQRRRVRLWVLLILAAVAFWLVAWAFMVWAFTR